MKCERACTPPAAERPNRLTNDQQEPPAWGGGSCVPPYEKHTNEAKTPREA